MLGFPGTEETDKVRYTRRLKAAQDRIEILEGDLRYAREELQRIEADKPTHVLVG